MQKPKKPIPANEQTVALLIGMLQLHEERFHELEIENAALSVLFQRFVEVPEFRTQYKVAVRIARTRIHAPAKNNIESRIRRQLAEIESLLLQKKQKPN